jgi:hypothetical protein
MPHPYGDKVVTVVRKMTIMGVPANLLLVGQLHKLLFCGTGALLKVCESTWRSAIPKLHKETDKAVLSRLRALQAIGTQAPQVTIASVKCITSAMEEVGLPYEVVDVVARLIKAQPPSQKFYIPPSANSPTSSTPSPSLGFKPSPSLKSPPTTATPKPQPPLTPSTTSTPTTNPFHSISSTPTSMFPLKLDIPVLLDAQQKETYGLLSATNQVVPQPLKGQVSDFMAWSKSLIQLDR